MKQFIFRTALVVTMGFVSVTLAVDRPSSVDRAIDNYLIGLKMDNTGIRESAIINIMKLKLAYPDLNYEPLIEVLDSLAEKSRDRVIRRKASVTASFLKYPERFNWIDKNTCEENNAFFELVALKLEIQEQNVQKKWAASHENE